MTKDLVILGAGVHAAEMVEIVERINADRKQWNLIGLIAKHAKDKDRAFNGAPVLGTFDELPPLDAYYAVSNANRLPASLGVDPAKLVSLIDPTAFVSRTATIGRGCVVYPGCFIGLQAKLSDLVFLLANCTLNHDVTVGERAVFTSGVTLAGGVQVGAGAYLGQSCTVREKVAIGERAYVGMGAVVVKDVAPGKLVVGNPARPIRDRKPTE